MEIDRVPVEAVNLNLLFLPWVINVFDTEQN